MIKKTHLKECLNKIFNSSDEEILKKSQNAYNLSKNYEWENVIGQYKKMYEELISTKI